MPDRENIEMHGPFLRSGTRSVATGPAMVGKLRKRQNSEGFRPWRYPQEHEPIHPVVGDESDAGRKGRRKDGAHTAGLQFGAVTCQINRRPTGNWLQRTMSCGVRVAALESADRERAKAEEDLRESERRYRAAGGIDQRLHLHPGPRRKAALCQSRRVATHRHQQQRPCRQAAERSFSSRRLPGTRRQDRARLRHWRGPGSGRAVPFRTRRGMASRASHSAPQRIRGNHRGDGCKPRHYFSQKNGS